MTLEKELKLINEAKEDIDAFNKLYNHYFPKILAYCINRLSNKENAEDITSKVFLATIENIDKFDTSKGLRLSAWLYRVANNKIIDFFRKNKNKMLVGIDNYDDGEEIDYNKDIALTEKQQQIQYILSIIKPKYREIISLRFHAQLDNEEIAQVLKIKKTHVAVILFRAIKAFKKEYLKKYPISEIFDFE